MRMTNKEFAKTESFLELCKEIGVTPTVRQASKYRRKKGLAWKAPQHKEKS